jgi:DNA-binding response OmpR family regulator
VPDVILVVEDELGIVDFLERGLGGHGFEVRSARNGAQGAEMALAEHIDLLVLDLMLPGMSGLEVLEQVRRAKPTLPVIMLTARGEVEDRVAGLNAGAVDYLTKPFSLSELAARIRAQLRAATLTANSTVTGAGIEADLFSREVRHQGTRVALSPTEFDLLVYLMRNRGRVVSREQILRAVWGYGHDPGTNVVDVYVGYLRRKLREAVGGREAPIVTVRSVGYRLDARD